MSSFVTEWARAQVPRGSTTQPSSVFLRNLEQELDIRREQSALMTLHNRGDAIDFSSGNMLGLSTTSVLRTAFLNELEQHRNFSISSGGSRLTDGNSEYLEGLEQELAEFHGAEAALFVLSGAIGNGAIFSVIPRPGDAIVYDELAHASILDGMKGSLALCQKAFRHNRVDSFRDTLEAVKSTQPQIANGSHSVLVAVESMYSMDGDTCPLKELVDIAKEVFPKGNIEFVVDEAWTTGVVGPRGAGLVAALGLENDIAIRLHTCGKALGASGAAIICHNTVRMMLLNYSREIHYSYSPSFPMIASARAAYSLMKTGQTQEAQARAQYLVELFHNTLASNPIWDEANDLGLLRSALYDEYQDSPPPFVSCIQPILTRPKHHFYLAFHLQLAGFSVFPISYPVVPKGADRVRIIIHASNTDAQVEALAASICTWAQEMLEIEKSGKNTRLPSAAHKAYALMTNGSV